MYTNTTAVIDKDVLTQLVDKVRQMETKIQMQNLKHTFYETKLDEANEKIKELERDIVSLKEDMEVVHYDLDNNFNTLKEEIEAVDCDVNEQLFSLKYKINKLDNESKKPKETM
jgi:chromosome segregation ATPase